MNCCFSKKKKFHKIHPQPTKPLEEQPKSILKNKRVKRKSVYPQQNNRSLISENKRINEEIFF